uniref:HIT domain-containing protein n=1 Tax=Serinus canaria TaxID=9135 RepID=A0A8C9NTA9_SERCA
MLLLLLSLEFSYREYRTFHDLSTQARMLFPVVPKEQIIRLSKAEDSDSWHVMIFGEMCVAHLGLTNGFRMVVDEGPKGGQSVYHIHPSILGGHQLRWTPAKILAPQDLLHVYKSPLVTVVTLIKGTGLKSG